MMTAEPWQSSDLTLINCCVVFETVSRLRVECKLLLLSPCIYIYIYTLRVVPPAFSANGPKMRITFCVKRKDSNRAEKVTASSRTQLEQQRSLH